MSDIFQDGSDVLGGGSQSGSTPARTGATLAALNAGGTPADGTPGILRIGTWPNQHEVYLTWNNAQSKWVGEEEIVITQGDSWAMDLSNRTGAQMVDWSDIDAAIPFAKAHGIIEGPLDLSAAAFNPATATGVITVDTTTPAGKPAFTNSSSTGFYGEIRDNFISWTGRTATTLTGCAVAEGSRGTIPDGEYVTQGHPGGWGFVASPVAYADSIFAAGFQLQERFSALMNSAPVNGAVTEKLLTAAPYWYQYDANNGHQPNAIPLTGGVGRSASIVSLAGTGGTLGLGERSFYLVINDWTDWPLAAPTKHYLLPKIVGKMDAGAYTSGSILDAKLTVRWVSV